MPTLQRTTDRPLIPSLAPRDGYESVPASSVSVEAGTDGDLETTLAGILASSPSSSGVEESRVEELIEESQLPQDRRITRLDQLSNDLSLKTHATWTDSTDAAVAGFALAALASFARDEDAVAGLTYRTSVSVTTNGDYVPIIRVPHGDAPNTYRITRTGSSADPLHGVFYGGGFTRGSSDYVYYAGSLTLASGDTLTMQTVGEEVTTEFGGDVARLAAYARNPQANGASLTAPYRLTGSYQRVDYDADVFANDTLPEGRIMEAPETTGSRRVQIHFRDEDFEDAPDAFAAMAQAGSLLQIIRDDNNVVLFSGNLRTGTVTRIGGNLYRFDLVPGARRNTFGVAVRVEVQSAIDAAIRTDAEIAAVARTILPPFLDIQPLPAGISGTAFPDHVDLVFTERMTTKTITDVVLRLGGQQLTLDSGTPVSGIDATEAQGILRFGISGTHKTALATAAATARFLACEVVTTYSDGTTHQFDFPFLVNNAAFHVPARFEQVVGASPATLPEGSFEISIVGDDTSGSRAHYGILRILLSDIPAADRVFIMRLFNNDDVQVTMRYAPNTRTLTYSSTSDSNNAVLTMKAIGEN